MFPFIDLVVPFPLLPFTCYTAQVYHTPTFLGTHTHLPYTKHPLPLSITLFHFSFSSFYRSFHHFTTTGLLLPAYILPTAPPAFLAALPPCWFLLIYSSCVFGISLQFTGQVPVPQCSLIWTYLLATFTAPQDNHLHLPTYKLYIHSHCRTYHTHTISLFLTHTVSPCQLPTAFLIHTHLVHCWPSYRTISTYMYIVSTTTPAYIGPPFVAFPDHYH